MSISDSKGSRNKSVVELSKEEREYLLELVSVGSAPAKKLMHARILLQSDDSEEGKGYEDDEIAEILDVSEKTVYRIRKRFVEEGLESALNRRPHKQYKPRRLDGEQEAHLIALACSQAPAGSARWTLRLLADQMVALEITDKVCKSTIHETLKKMSLSLG